uniref:Uncharacterized protein n=1 Tax=viral metagenome TaxID=1070528 RepID=A0A6M3LN92_9ZZZZ
MESILKLVPLLCGLVGLVEAFVKAPKSGPTKKLIVATGVKAAVEGMTEISTGGQKEAWAKMSTQVDEAIDAVAALLPTKMYKTPKL